MNALTTRNRDGRVIVGSQSRTVAEMRTRAARLATGLAAAGLDRGTSLLAVLDNSHAFYEAEYAARRVGARFVPISTQLREDELRYIAADCDATAAVVHPGSEALLRAAVPDIAVVVSGRDDVELVESCPPWRRRAKHTGAPMLYTSGTTGRPKGVLRSTLTATQSEAMNRWAEQLFGVEDGMRTVIANPLYHSAAWGYSATVLQHGGVVVLEQRFDAARLLELIEQHRITHLQVVPTMMHRLLQLPAEVRRRYDVSSLRHVLHGAGPCSPATKRNMIDWWGPVLVEYYGSTETGAVVSCTSLEWLQRPGTVGRARDGAVVRILDDDGNELPAGHVGTIWVFHPASPPFSYLNREPEQTIDGLITCGDVGRLDEDGYLYLTDRRTDLIVCGGVNIYPVEIELALLEMPGIADCAVIGVSDEEMGQIAVAIIEPLDAAAGPPITVQSVREFLHGRLARNKQPRRVVTVGRLPRGENGKVRRQDLRDLIGTVRTSPST